VALLTETGPTLIVAFDDDGSLKLSGITGDLIGLPLGIFIDDQLMAAPQVSASIENGQLPIAGLSLRNARILRAQLRAGAVPAPFTATFE
jgi:preprotein translocase subunit SecD